MQTKVANPKAHKRGKREKEEEEEEEKTISTRCKMIWFHRIVVQNPRQ